MADQHSIFVPIAMFGAVPAILVLFAALKPHQAVIWAHVLGWLFLPWVSYETKGALGFLPDFTRTVAIGTGVAIGVGLFDYQRVLSFRPRWHDAFVIALCISPLLSSLANGLGVFDGLSGVAKAYFLWGQPYFLGRFYLDNREAVKDAARAIVIASLIYVPLCLFELRMSPQLYGAVYGGSEKVRGFGEAHRYGGWRPRVFFEAGLALGMWMTYASISALSLAVETKPTRLLGLPTAVAFIVLLVITIACKATGAILLLAFGLVAFVVVSSRRMTMPILLLVLIPPSYITLRTAGIWDGEQLVSTAATYFGDERAQSLQFRFENEDMLAARALQRPLFGWGGWGRQRVRDEYGKNISIIDGLWIVKFGANGLFGLTALFASLLIPPAILALDRRNGVDFVVSGFAIGTVLYGIDCLLNGMPNPVFHLALGAVACWPISTLEHDETAAVLDVAKDMPAKQRISGSVVAPRQLWPPKIG